MLVLRLAIDVDELGQAGSLVIADTDQTPGVGDWVVIRLPDGFCCQRWCEDISACGTVIRVLA